VILAVLGGLGAALAFAVSTLASTRSSRLIGALPTVGWVTLIGLPIVVVAVAMDVKGFSAGALPWLALAGVGNVTGLILGYSALRVGRVGVVAPLLSTEGAVAALISTMAGDPMTVGLLAALVLIALGGALTAAAAGTPGAAIGDPNTDAERPSPPRPAWVAIGLALLAAVAFGASLYATARIGRSLPIAWAALAPRVIGALAVAGPLAVASRLRLSRRAAPMVGISGVAEVAGFLSIGFGARADIAVTSVLASQFAAVAAIGAVFVFGERLKPVQRVGIVLIALGTALVALVGV
jgi:drug/metabolite transporter (DMT)-like permease